MTDAARKPSFAQMAKAVAKLGKFLTVRKDGKGDFKSIQAAIDAAPPNSIVEIQDNGHYNEQIKIHKEKPGLTLRGRKGFWPVITSTGLRQHFKYLVETRAPRTTVERLVLAHGKTGDVHDLALSAMYSSPCRVRSAILYCDSEDCVHLSETSGPTEPKSVIEECVVTGGVALGTRGLARNCLLFGYLGSQYARHSVVAENVLVRRITGCVAGSELRSCTLLGRVMLLREGVLLLDCVVDQITATGPNNRVDYCDVFGKPAFMDMAKPGRKCFGMDPKFRDPENFDYRLKRTSPCRGRASDGGDIGCRYTKEMLEMLKLAHELRKKGIIKF